MFVRNKKNTMLLDVSKLEGLKQALTEDTSYLDEPDEDIDLENSNDQALFDEIKRNNTLSFTLDYQQLRYIQKIINFINNPKEKEILITGGPGTGKSTIVSQVIAYLQNNGYSFAVCAPTHKARINLDKMTGLDNSLTLHQLLQLSPKIDVLELDLRELEMECHLDDRRATIPGLIIIDECSMITTDLYTFIQDKLIKERGVKLIFVGDSAQLKGVNESTISQVFTLENKITLTKIYRQKEDAPLLYILQDLREKPLTKRLEDFTSPSGDLYNCLDVKDFIIKAAYKFKDAIINQDIEAVKILTYTNEKVRQYNTILHNILFKKQGELEFCPKEFVMGYDNYKIGKQTIVTNSMDYLIKDITDGIKQADELFPFDVKGYNILLDSEPWKPDVERVEGIVSGRYRTLFFMSKVLEPEMIEQYTYQLENLRRQAVSYGKESRTKGLSKLMWKNYFKLSEAFAVPEDLYYDGKLVRNATIKLSYAISIHKAQGSSITDVFFDLHDVKRCWDKEELRQLEYVALSRARRNVFILN